MDRERIVSPASLPADWARLDTNQLRDHLASVLRTCGQQHLLSFWDELDEAERRALATEIAGIDFAEIARLWRSACASGDEGDPWQDLATRAEPPRAIRLQQRSVDRESARRLGGEALSRGQIGVLLVAGGQGSRLGFAHPKGMYPIGPLSQATLFEILIGKVVAMGKRYGARIPLYLMTSPATHVETVEFLAAHDRFGLAADDLHVFCQATMPAVDAATGGLLLGDRGRLFLSPDGHGGMLAALVASGGLEQIVSRSIRHLFYFQVDNPLVPVCDPEIIGHHLAGESELTSLAIAKTSPADRLGNFVSVDGKLRIIEYSDFPAEVAARTDSHGELVFWAGSPAIHIFDVAFLDRAATADNVMPFHMARKCVPHLDATGGRVEPAEPNAFKFERFIFDLLPSARNPLVIEVAESDTFAPLKNAPGAARDTADDVQRRMVAVHRRWLQQSGADVAPGGVVEISPRWAVDQSEVAERIEDGTPVTDGTYYD